LGIAAPCWSGETTGGAQLASLGAASSGFAPAERAPATTEEEPADEEPADAGSPDENGQADETAEEKQDKENEQNGGESKKETEQKAADDPKEKAGQEENGEQKEKDEDASAKTHEPAKKKLKTHTVTPSKFRVEVDMSGTFVAKEMSEISLRPKVWSQFEITKVVEHGSQVKAGDVLIEFDDESLNDTITAMELELHLSELGIRRAEQELPQLEKKLEMSLETAELEDRRAEENFDRFKELEKAFYEKLVDYIVKEKDYMLNYERDELEQLEKMYTADDLTEETEEIVLKRQRDEVDMATFNVEDAQFYRDGVLKITLPRLETAMQDAVDRADLALAAAKMDQSLDINRARYELEKLRLNRTKALEKHAELLGDRSLMTIKAPADGIVYFGRCVDGAWSETSSMINKLQPHGNATPGSVLITVVGPRPMYITAVVGEGELPAVQKGQPAKVSPPPKDAGRIEAEVSRVAVAPHTTGKFRVDLELREDELAEWLVPGMSCKIKVTTYEKEDALVVPKGALHADDDNEDQHYVWVINQETDQPERRDVEVGRRGDDDVEIVKGLEAGEEVSLEGNGDDKKKS
jgi:multidrug efflux pump subunit AcrA (membrane-fusion protein)